MDPDGYGGAPILGLNGTVIKAHGSAREKAFLNAVRVATEAIQHKISESISRQVGRAGERWAAPRAAGPAPAEVLA
jgi:glycerol-3-phosphate acyltransferase PlsX